MSAIIGTELSLDVVVEHGWTGLLALSAPSALRGREDPGPASTASTLSAGSSPTPLDELRRPHIDTRTSGRHGAHHAVR